MGHSVTLGGDRLGSGNKNKVYLHNYERSTHNLSTDFLSTMGCGMLIPFMCKLVTRDDKYEIDLAAGLRTIPTKGPLFGSFKLQLDVFQYPLRLCQALLHNNPLAIGLKASQVKFPKVRLYGRIAEMQAGEKKTFMAAKNSLVKYLGISGIGTYEKTADDVEEELNHVYRDMFGAGVIAYYDIFKNYYANKQEEYAYTITTLEDQTEKRFLIKYDKTKTEEYEGLIGEITWNVTINYRTQIIKAREVKELDGQVRFIFNIEKEFEDKNEFDLNKFLEQNITLYYQSVGTTPGESQPTYSDTIANLAKYINYKDGILEIGFDAKVFAGENDGVETYNYLCVLYMPLYAYIYQNEVELSPFKLENIDKMRYDILSFHQLGESFVLDSYNNLISPYADALSRYGYEQWQNPLAGICVKTYQSDLYNNWLNTEIIDGENGIAEITAISTSDGSITIDQLQFAEKLYNLLNRIAVSGGTYEDYLDAAYTASTKKFSESPIWLGGLSDEIVFEEIVQTAPAADGSELGSLGGRGNLMGKTKGGKITVKIDEPSLIIGIVSITPRIVYTQGNEWYNTEIDNLADIHVPALDAIGFQNLIGEQLHAGSTILNNDGTYQERPIIGKVPAWINYMTDVDRAYGDFAAEDGDGYMVLNRNYKIEGGYIDDATTYIDPAKYNYAFAYTKREAQNFWVKIKADIKARRLISAKQIPTA